MNMFSRADNAAAELADLIFDFKKNSFLFKYNVSNGGYQF